jgi:hypothetical protein
MTTKTTRIWDSIDAMAGSAAVLAEWRLLVGDDFDYFQQFLYSNDQRALDYPCTHSRRCGCRHEIIPHPSGKLTAACRCTPAECKSIPLKQADTLLHHVGVWSIAEATRLAFGLERICKRFNPLQRETDVHDVGLIGLKKHSVHLVCGRGHDELLSEIDHLLQYPGGFFLLVTPTAKHHSNSTAGLGEREPSGGHHRDQGGRGQDRKPAGDSDPAESGGVAQTALAGGRAGLLLHEHGRSIQGHDASREPSAAGGVGESERHQRGSIKAGR